MKAFSLPPSKHHTAHFIKFFIVYYTYDFVLIPYWQQQHHQCITSYIIWRTLSQIFRKRERRACRSKCAHHFIHAYIRVSCIEICHSSECAHLFTHSFSLFVWSLTRFITFKYIHPKAVVTPIMGMVFSPNRFGKTGSLCAKCFEKRNRAARDQFLSRKLVKVQIKKKKNNNKDHDDGDGGSVNGDDDDNIDGKKRPVISQILILSLLLGIFFTLFTSTISTEEQVFTSAILLLTPNYPLSIE